MLKQEHSEHSHDSPPFLSIVIATYNRASLIDEAIASLSNQIDSTTGKSITKGFEILIVDNASTDSTQLIVERWQSTLSNLRYILEKEQGVNYARNRGLAQARGSYVLFMDDECTVDKDYVSRLALVLYQSSPVLFGGPVYPRYQQNPAKPPWFCDKYGTFSHFETATSPDHIWLSGANMGGQRKALIELGGFSTKLGPKGERMIYGEEHELTERVKQKFGNSCVRYFSDIIVYHLVRPEKYSVLSNLREQCLRGYWRGQLSHTTSQSNSVQPARTVNIDKKELVLELLKTPLLRDRTKYPYLQNYVIEVVAPFLRVIFIGIGKLRR